MNIKKISRDALPNTLREPVRELLHQVRYHNNRATVFNNLQGFLPPAHGNTYYEYDSGQDRQGGRGSHRFVALMSPGKQLLKLYFTSAHYMGQWTEITGV